MTDFEAQVSSWTRETKQRVNAVYRTAVNYTVDDMMRTKGDGGSMPIDTGNLRRSAMLSTTAMPRVAASGTEFAGQDMTLTIAGLKAGDVAYFGFQAAYAARMEYGFIGADKLGRNYNQTGNYFVTKAIAKWVQNVKAAENKMRLR